MEDEGDDECIRAPSEFSKDGDRGLGLGGRMWKGVREMDGRGDEWKEGSES